MNSFQAATHLEDLIRDAFKAWEDVANIQIVRVEGNDANINIGLFNFALDSSVSQFAGFAYFPGADSTDAIAGDIFIDPNAQNDFGLWLHEIGHALGLEHPHDGARILIPSLDDASQTIMSYNGVSNVLGPMDRQAIGEMYSGTPLTNLHISEYEMLNAPRGDMFQQLRDYDGNLLGAPEGWKYKGKADVQLDNDDEFIFVNPTLGRWATVGPDAQSMVNFDNHGQGGDTRVVGVYLDPLVEAGLVVKGSDIDSARRLENDFRIDNLKIVSSGDFDRDGFQNVYFKTEDGTAYLNALMHADGNIRYANYQSEAQMIDYLTQNGWDSSTYDAWLTA